MLLHAAHVKHSIFRALYSMADKIDIWSRGEVVSYLGELAKNGQIKECKYMRLEHGHANAFYPRCEKQWASRVSATNVPIDMTAYSGPSSYSWPQCPNDCPHEASVKDFRISVSRDQFSVEVENNKNDANQPLTTTKDPDSSPIESHPAPLPTKSWWQYLTAPQASLLAAVIALAPAAVTGAYTYMIRPTRDEAGEQARYRIEKKLPKRSGYKSYISPRIGIGFNVPLAWQIDDAIHVFGGGEIDLIRHYDTEANSISEGIKFALRVVQGNYVKYPQKEEDNYMDTVRKIDPKASIERAEINGQVGVKISYKQSTGKRIGQISRYWLRLHDRAKLEVVVFTNLGEDRKEFLDEARDTLSSIVIDEDVIATNTKAIDR